MPRNRLRFQHRQDVVFDRQLAEDRRLLRQVADPEVPRPKVHRNIGDILVVDDYPAGVGGNEADNDVKAGGFSGAVGTQQADNFALFYVEADAVDDPASAVTFADLVRR